MSSFFKKTAISMIVLGMAGSSYAAMSSMNHNTNTSGMHGWFIGVDGLDLQPRNGDLDYVTVYPATSGALDNGIVSNNAISTHYDWGFRLFGGLKFGDNDDVKLDWTRHHVGDSDSTAGITTAVFARWIGSISAPTAPTVNRVDANVDFDLDNVSLVMGHMINFNNPWSVRFAGGLEYAKLNSDFTVNGLNNNTLVTGQAASVFAENTLSMKGIGPRVEGNAVYHLSNNFGLFMDANAALLIANRDLALNYTYPSTFDPLVDNDLVQVNYTNRHVVVPHLGMRIGLNWAYYFGQAGGEGTCNVLGLEAGWQADSYIEAIEREAGESVIYTSRTSVVPGTTKTSNYSNQGLFLGINFASNWF